MSRSPLVLLTLAASAASLLPGCPTASTDPSELACGGEEAVVQFSTDDDVQIVADYRPAATPNQGAVVFVHMVPPANDRTTWPASVRDAVSALDLNVLVIDRRGAGESGGEPVDAYEGDGGRLDVEAAMRFLTSPDLACPVAASAIALVGASNGTTSVLDYTVGHDPALPAPEALVWMSPGGYTENQNRIGQNLDVLASVPLLWLFPTNEDYAEAYEDDGQAAWRFVQQGEAHGTRMFDGGSLEDSTIAELTGWFDRWLVL